MKDSQGVLCVVVERGALCHVNKVVPWGPTVWIVSRSLVFYPVLACVSRYLFSFMHSAQLMIDSRSNDTAFWAGSRPRHSHPHSLMLSCVFWDARALH